MVKTGLDIFFEEGIYQKIKDKKIGLLVHSASINSRFIHICQLFKQFNLKVEMIFTPEHGFGAEAQDMEAVINSDQSFEYFTKSPVFSLYGNDYESLFPDVQLVNRCDIIIADLQDVGSRYYTFIWTALHCLEKCYEAGVELWLLDRPNPINGINIEGPIISPEFYSFVGKAQCPIRHGLTIGELLKLAATERKIEKCLKIIKMAGWKREMFFADTNLPWTFPSPNMPTQTTALVYPGICLIEGTNISEGRGTTKPFEIIGAPFLSYELSEILNNEKLPGVFFRPITFKPKFQKFADKECNGIEIHITDKNLYLPVRTGLAIIWAIKKLYPQSFLWRTEKYEFVDNIPAIDLLFGNDLYRKMIDDGIYWKEISNKWELFEKDFINNRPLIY